jgi:DNA end-binding protein Ku
MAGDFKPEEFSDDYRAALQQVIDAKVNGKEIVAPPEVEEAPSGAIDLMAALRASVERAKAARESGVSPAEHEPVTPTPIHSARSAAKKAPAKKTAAAEAPAKKTAAKKATPAKATEEKAAPAKKSTAGAGKKTTAKKAPAKARKSA